jgi:hypothetical protein
MRFAVAVTCCYVAGSVAATTPETCRSGMDSEALATSMTLWEERSLALNRAICSYELDWGHFPPCRETSAGSTFLDDRQLSDTATISQPLNYLEQGLSLERVNRDPFRNDAAFAYVGVLRGPGTDYGWCLISAGPDRVLQIDVRDYRPNSARFATELLHKLYDPTNGTCSSGDLFKSKEVQDFKAYGSSEPGFVQFVSKFYSRKPVE